MIGIITLNHDTFTNPTIYSIIKELNSNNIEVIIFSGNNTTPIPSELNLTTYSDAPNGLKLPRNPINIFQYFKKFLNVIRVIRKNRIKHIIAVDPLGLVLTGRILKFSSFKTHYFSFEIFFKEEIKDKNLLRLKNEECEYSRNVDSIVIQDKKRQSMLSGENSISNSFKNWFLIPVSPISNKLTTVKKYTKEEFGFKASDTVYIHAGSVDTWSGAESIIKAAKSKLPKNTYILVHNRSKFTESNPIHKQLLDLAAQKNQLKLHDDHFNSYEEYCAFLKCFDYGIAIYKPDNEVYTGKNIREIGLSSGKFSTLMFVGLPTILSNSSIYKELVEKYKIGVIATETQDLEYHIKNKSLINLNSEACKMCYIEVLDPQKAINDYIDFLKN